MFLNAGAAYYLYNGEITLEESFDKIRNILESGKVFEKLKNM